MPAPALASLLFAVLAAGAQTARAAPDDSGALRVAVLTEERQPLSGVGIVAEARNGRTWQATTNARGIAVLGLGAGLYRVVASHPRHVQVVDPVVRVVRNKTIPLEFVLRAGVSDEIVVVASAIRKDAYGSVGASFLDREALRTAAGSGADVLRALDGLPGLVSKGDFANFTVRGRGPRDNLILVDGFPYNKVVHFDSSLGEREDIEGGGRFSIFAPNLIAGAEFSPGGWSAAYGGRNGSMLKLNVARGNPSPSASVRLDLAGAELVYDGPSGLREDTSVIASLRQFDFGRLFKLIGENDIGSPVMTDFIFKTHTRIDADNEFEFLVLHTPEQMSRDVEHVLESDNFEDRELLEQEQDSTLIGATWTRRIGDGGRWENRVFHRDTDKTSREGEAFSNAAPMALPQDQVPIRRDILALAERTKAFGWRSDLTLPNRLGTFAAGWRAADVDVAFGTTLAAPWTRFDFASGDFRPAPAQRFIVLTPDETNAAFARRERQYAAYAEQLFERGDWHLRTGLRFEHDGFSAQSTVSPRFSAGYALSPALRLAATAGRFYQSPRYLERAADAANFGLENERVDHVSVGLERQFGPHWSLLVEAYHQQLEALVTDGDPVTGVAGNNGEGASYGVDFVANRQFADGWSANAVYSYNEATLDDNDGHGEYPADYNHKHLLSVGARWEISARWQLGLRWKYATGRPRDDYVLHEDVLAAVGGPLRYAREYTSNNTLRWDAFHTMNVRVDYRRPIGPVDAIAFLDILNVYGATATDEEEFNTATGTLVADDGEVFPLIGLRFEKTW